MKRILSVLIVATALLAGSCTKQASNQLATEQSKKGKGHTPLETTATTVTLTNNGGGSFSVDYGGATDVVYMFFRWGDSLSASGNVIPVSTQPFYLNPVTTFMAWGSGTYYQAVVITGSTERDVNGVLGADWVTSYSNVVQ